MNVGRLPLDLIPQVVALEVRAPWFAALPLAIEVSRQTLDCLPQAKAGFVHVFLHYGPKSIRGATNRGNE
jgi:hypothetical protein